MQENEHLHLSLSAATVLEEIRPRGAVVLKKGFVILEFLPSSRLAKLFFCYLELLKLNFEAIEAASRNTKKRCYMGEVKIAEWRLPLVLAALNHGVLYCDFKAYEATFSWQMYEWVGTSH